MANETTTTSANDVAYSAIIEPIFMDYAHDWIVATPFLKEKVIGRGSASYQFNRIDSDMGTVGANGAGVDTEFGAAEATDLSNTEISTSKVTVTAAEYGVLNTLTDNLVEDSIEGVEWMQIIIGNSARILMTALEHDVLTLLSGFSTSVGSSGSDLTVAQLLAAFNTPRKLGVRAPDGLVCVLDDEQVDNVEAALTATGTSMAVYAGATDRLFGYAPAENNGLGNGHVMNFRGSPVFATGLGPTANTAADVTGGVFVPETPGNSAFAALGIVWKRAFRLEPERDASLRATEYVGTMRCGVGELSDSSGCAIITDAP